MHYLIFTSQPEWNYLDENGIPGLRGMLNENGMVRGKVGFTFV
jgi:hypothetical protein